MSVRSGTKCVLYRLSLIHMQRRVYKTKVNETWRVCRDVFRSTKGTDAFRSTKIASLSILLGNQISIRSKKCTLFHFSRFFTRNDDRRQTEKWNKELSWRIIKRELILKFVGIQGAYHLFLFYKLNMPEHLVISVYWFP